MMYVHIVVLLCALIEFYKNQKECKVALSSKHTRIMLLYVAT